jgi:hypothetical protein
MKYKRPICCKGSNFPRKTFAGVQSVTARAISSRVCVIPSETLSIYIYRTDCADRQRIVIYTPDGRSREWNSTNLCAESFPRCLLYL